jgi:hypothetical protein
MSTGNQNEISFMGFSLPIIRIHNSITFNDDPKFFTMGMSVAVMHCSRGHHGPADEQIVGTSLRLVDGKLNLHIDPTLIST